VTLSELKTSADTKVDFKGDLNARVDSLIASLKNNKELKHFLQHL